MRIFYAPDSIAMASHIALQEGGWTYQTELIAHDHKFCADGTPYLSINPKGYVPALELADGQVLTESVATLIYIGENAPVRGLEGGEQRYKVIEWLTFVATELHQRFMRFPQPGLTPELTEATKEQLRERFGYAASHLSPEGHLVGDQLTTADIFLYVAARWLRYVDIDVAQWPRLAQFMDGMRQRPAVQAVLPLHDVEQGPEA